MNHDTKTASIEPGRHGRFDLYVPRQVDEPADQRPYRGQFNSWSEAAGYKAQHWPQVPFETTPS